MSWYVRNKDLLKVVWNVRRIHDKLHFDDILLNWSNSYRQTLQKIYLQKKILIKALDTEILSLEEFHCKTTQDIA